MYYEIVSNSSSALIIDLAGDDFSGVASGDGFAISRFWTLGTLFPPATQTAIVPSNTEVLIPDLKGDGINRAASHIFFIENNTWISALDFSVADNFIFLPDAYFIIRHNSSTITASTNFYSMGTVELNPVSMPLATLTTGEQDNHTTTGRLCHSNYKTLAL